VEKKVCSRRSFFKTSALAAFGLGFFGKLTTNLSSAFASGKELADNLIKRQGYIHDAVSSKGPASDEKSMKSYNKHVGKMNKAIKGLPKAASVTPRCSNCKYYKPIAGSEYGKCAMVGATGKPGKQVFKNGWCKIFRMKTSTAKKMAS